MSSEELELDEHGNIKTMPVTGWTTAVLAEIAVLLKIQYVERPQEIETGGKSLQLVLMPQQCLELAAQLTKFARLVLDSQTRKPPQ
jgi:hypothetical protein